MILIIIFPRNLVKTDVRNINYNRSIINGKIHFPHFQPSTAGRD